ncbi:MAG: hypothetical protein QNJ61_12090 [Desulfobacterales bacterium]|nr:hypothetical protein [Desulfobacterales bacterium]
MGIKTLAILAAILASAGHFAMAASMDPGGPGFLHLNSGLEQEYNDNLFFSPSDQEEDLISTGTFGIEAGYKSEKTEINLKPLWRFYKYVENTDLDDNDQLYRATLEHQVTPRFSLNAKGAYINDNRREDQVEETGVVFENVERTRWEGLLAAEYLLSEKAAVNAFGQYWNDDYEDRRLRSSLSDLEAAGGGIGFSHLMSVFYHPTYFRLNTGYFNYDYDSADTDYYYLTMGASAEINETYTFMAEAGPRYTDSEFDAARRESIPGTSSSSVVIRRENSSDWGWNGLLSLAYRGEKTKWELGLSREITASSGETQTVEQTELRLDYDCRWTWEWSTNLLMRYYYKESDRENSDIDDGAQDTLIVQPRVRYRINNDWFLQGSYRYTWRDDNDFDESWDRNQMLFQIGHNWKIWE